MANRVRGLLEKKVCSVSRRSSAVAASLQAALRLLLLIHIIVALLGAPPPVSGFVPLDPMAQAPFHVAQPFLEANRLTPRMTAPPTSAEEAWVTAQLPGKWAVRWNRLTGTPHRIEGAGFDLVPGGFASAADVDRASRQFVDLHPELAGVGSQDLGLIAIDHAARHWSAIYQQTVSGIPVEGARVDFLYSETGRLLAFGSDAHRRVRLARSLALTADQALAAGAAGLPPSSPDGPPELRVLPIPSELPGEEELRTVFHLAYRMVLETETPLGRWVTWVDAGTGEVIWRYDEIRYLEISGHAFAEVEDLGYCDGKHSTPLTDLRVEVFGAESVFTTGKGNYAAPVEDNTARTVTAALRGRRVRIQNHLGANATFIGETNPNSPLAITWENAQDDELDVYVHATRAYDFIRTVDPDVPLGVLDNPQNPLPANVSLPKTCNAFWNGSSINFFREGSGCANTGRIGDVIYHEYGHAVTQFVYAPIVPPGDLHEGNSDIMANHMTELSLIGDGFALTCDQGIRDCSNDLRWPEDVAGQEIHAAGRVICGFDWDVRKSIEQMSPAIFAQRSDSLWHFTRRLLRPTTQPDQVTGYFFLDDDDFDLSNGTPHYDGLCLAAERHGFTPPGPAQTRPVTVTHSPLHSVLDSSGPYDVVATIVSSAAAVDLALTAVHYQVNGGPAVDLPMTPAGAPDDYHAMIPAQPVGSRITYTITTADLAGNGGAWPPSRCFPDTPSGSEVFHVATVLDELEVESGWTVGIPEDNAATGIWERVDPVGTAAQPENDRTPAPGNACFVTGQGQIGGGLGDADVDGGTTTLLSPVFALDGVPGTEILYHRWYSNDTGADPGIDVWRVNATSDGGKTWLIIESTNASDASWREVRVDLDKLFGVPPEQVQLKFVASDLDNGSLIEAGVDEVMIFAGSAKSAVSDEVAAAPARFALGPNVPNPFNPETQISFELPARTALSLLVYDSAGRLVRVLADHIAYEAGVHELRWDGRDDRGQRAAAGVYHVRMAGPGFAESHKVVMVK
jgi:Zn-dependent metalloprotease